MSDNIANGHLNGNGIGHPDVSNMNVSNEGSGASLGSGSTSGTGTGTGTGTAADMKDDESGSVDMEKGFEAKDRRKIEIKFIENKTRRHVTFSKRKHGIMKKAFELSVLTGTQVLLLIVSETGLVYTFSTPKFEPIVTQQEGRNLIQACLNAPDEEEEEEEEEDQDEEDGSNANEDDKLHGHENGSGEPQQHGDISAHLNNQVANQQDHHQQQQQAEMMQQQHPEMMQQQQPHLQHRPEQVVHLPPGQHIQYPNMGNMPPEMNGQYIRRQDQPESTYQQYFQDSTNGGV